MQPPTKIRAGIIGLALTFFLVLQLLSNYPASVEKYYTNGIYPILTLVVSKITSQIPFSITEFLLWTAVLIGIPYTLRRIRQKRMQLGALILNLLSISAVIYMWFYLFWGINYLRQPLKSKLDLENEQGNSLRLRWCTPFDVLFHEPEQMAVRKSTCLDCNGSREKAD